jgi:hypothetical protein
VNGEDDAVVQEFSTEEFIKRLDLPPGSIVTSVGMIWFDILHGSGNNRVRLHYKPGPVPHLRILPTGTLEERLRLLIGKWHAQANHPQRRNRPEERALLNNHAEELQRALMGKPPAGEAKEQ